MTLKAVFEKAAEFLELHSTETVIMIIKNDAGDDEEIAKAVDRYISSGDYPIYCPSEEKIPTLGEVRGKIVLMRRYSFESYTPNNPSLYFGPYLYNWDTVDYDTFSKEKKAVKIYDASQMSVWVQDAYKENPETKKEYVSGTWDQASGENAEIPSSGYVINYTSGTGGQVIPINYARTMNNWLLSKDSRDAQANKRLGIFMMNFVDGNLAQLVYDNNDFMETSIFPESITLTYGDSLAESDLVTYNADGTLAFENPDIVPGIEDSDKTLYTLVFTPYDTTQPVQKKDVTVTVKKRTITIKYAYKGRITLGDKTPLNYTPNVLYKDELVAGDDPSDIHIISKMVNQYGDTFDPDSLTEDTVLPTGDYEMFITNADTASDKYYPVLYEETEGSKEVVLAVRQLDPEWKWKNNKYVYMVGEELNITAEITNQVEGFPCEPTDYSDDFGTSKSSYDEKSGMWTLYSVSFSHLTDERNYSVPKIYETSTYYIVKAEGDPAFFPERVNIAAGKMLKSASLGNSKFEGAHLEFARDEQSKVLQVKDSGDYMVYLVLDETGESIPLGTTSVNVVAEEKQAVSAENNKTAKTEDRSQDTAKTEDRSQDTVKTEDRSQNTVKSAKTGDEYQMLPWVAVVSGSVVVILTCGVRRKKSR